MAFDASSFEKTADDTLAAFLDAIDEALGDRLEVDLQGGILTIELDSGGQYVINKHGPNRQIWMSSPVSGATHYDYDETAEQWIGTRDAGPLLDRIAAELKAKTGVTVELD